MNYKKKLRLIFEGWENEGIQDPFQNDVKRILVTYEVHPIEFPGSDQHIPQLPDTDDPIERLGPLARFDADFSTSLVDLPDSVWAETITRVLKEYTGAELHNIKILGKDVGFYKAENPLMKVTFEADVNYNNWIKSVGMPADAIKNGIKYEL